MTALRGSGVPVPMTYCLCSDISIIGTPFFVMSYVAGRIFKDILLPGMDRKERFAIYSELARVLATLHRIDPSSVGLGDYGLSDRKYTQRQVKRWASQYEAAKTANISGMSELISLLQNGAAPEN